MNFDVDSQILESKDKGNALSKLDAEREKADKRNEKLKKLVGNQRLSLINLFFKCFKFQKKEEAEREAAQKKREQEVKKREDEVEKREKELEEKEKELKERMEAEYKEKEREFAEKQEELMAGVGI